LQLFLVAGPTPPHPISLARYRGGLNCKTTTRWHVDYYSECDLGTFNEGVFLSRPSELSLGPDSWSLGTIVSSYGIV
jgi:hypothetical protein